ncbi:MAG TPA: RluA family pseudouridine synthase [Spirochaetia bacterium]|nr:RluA family pseudouridine synthase [Spirochaetaceae bacterium]HPE90077.1 RluA family pseudouridine synthase [Spirochaetales bacterium]HRW25257.1 RluA family pseudouridine synthase [Spirochaetia bacterium]
MATIRGRVEAVGPLRFDRYASEELKMLTRSQLKARFVSLSVNGKDAKLSRPVEAGDEYALELLDEEDRSSASAPEDIPLSVIYEDDRVVVVDKPQGMVVHPAHGNWSGTLANALLGRFAAEGLAAPARAGIVHRLDKDTSGVLIVGKSAAAQEALAAQFRARSTVKTYLAIVKRGPSADTGRLEGWLARDPRDRKRFAPSPEGVGKRALTEWTVLARAGGYAALALGLRTGRTHQLRVHCKALGCPILGDPIYGEADRRFPGATLMLHAWELRIRLPGDDERSAFRSPAPERFEAIAAALGLEGFPLPSSGDPSPGASPAPR